VEEPNHDAFVEFLNTFVIKGFEIYFGRKNIVYLISKQLITNAFGAVRVVMLRNLKDR
jgi:hypothetical protein